MTHNFPKVHLMYRSAEEFESAAKAWQAMGKIGVRPIEELEASWSVFLMHVERIWNKLQAGARGLSGWQKIESEVSNLRKNDPTLMYAHHARNATEHTIQEFATDWNGPLTAVSTQSTITVSWPAWDRPLLPVKDRGVTYQAPKKKRIPRCRHFSRIWQRDAPSVRSRGTCTAILFRNAQPGG
jgi:hypothetical protein